MVHNTALCLLQIPQHSVVWTCGNPLESGYMSHKVAVAVSVHINLIELESRIALEKEPVRDGIDYIDQREKVHLDSGQDHTHCR